VVSCNRGGSSPKRNTNFNGLTKNDGSFTWFNGRSYTPKAEPTNWGNTLLPMANFLTAGIRESVRRAGSGLWFFLRIS
jgi:hypothetical protein